jgi:NAD(P)H-dependent FMN reductase
LHQRLAAMEAIETELFDPQEMNLPILEERLSNLEEPPAELVRFGAAIERADGVVITTPEYNKGYPAALKNLIDALGPEWRRKPVAIAAHSVGAFGGTTALQSLRPVMTSLGAVAIPAAMTVPHISKAFDEDGTALDEAFAGRADKFLGELVWYAEALGGATNDADGRS